MTDGLESYHKLAREQERGSIEHCFAHARLHCDNAIKAMRKGDQGVMKSSFAYKALVHIGAIYGLEGILNSLSPDERLKGRQFSIKPLVEEYFAMIKKAAVSGTILPKTETGKRLQYSINQEEYLKVFLTDGEVLIDDLANGKLVLIELLIKIKYCRIGMAI